MADERIWYLLWCRTCEMDTPMPFDSAAARGKWATAHTAGTGHEDWTVVDQRPSPEDRVA